MLKILKALPLIAAVIAAATPASAGTLKYYAGPVTSKVTFEDILVSSYNTCAGAATYKVIYTNVGDGSVFKTKTGRVATRRAFVDTLPGGLAANKTLHVSLEHTCVDGTDKPPRATLSIGGATTFGALLNFEIQM